MVLKIVVTLLVVSVAAVLGFLATTNQEQPHAYGNSGRKKRQRLRRNGDAPFLAEECVVCLTADISVKLKPCNHACLCFHCAKELKRTQMPCPICRTAVVDYCLL